MDLAEDVLLPSNQSYLNCNISSNQRLIIELDYVKLFDVFELGINSNRSLFLYAVKNRLITIIAIIKRYKINFKQIYNFIFAVFISN
jgi:hypothetical protein